MVEVKMHDIGEGITEAEILHYLVQVGDRVKADQPVAEVQTDKMVAELPSPTSGIVKEILIPTGTVVKVGTTLMLIESQTEQGAVHSKPEGGRPASGEQTSEAGVPLRKFHRVLASPYTRKIAREHNVDIEQIKGSGPGGRVTEQDIFRYIELMKKESAAAVSVKETASWQISTATDRNSASERDLVPERDSAPELVRERDLAPERDRAPVGDDEASALSHRTIFQAGATIPFRGRRKAIAQKMVKSLYTIPHVTHFDDVDLTDLLRIREELKEQGIHLSAAAFFIKALTLALKEYPIFNARLDEEKEQIHLLREIHIGIAVDTEEGLIVPVLKHADRKSIRQIHEEMKGLIKKAQDNELRPADITGSTFTVSNVGPLGSTGATPIINYPETGLMAFHKTRKMPVVNKNDEIVIRSIMNISMSFDHRVADGATAVAFTNRFKTLLECPARLLVELV